MLSIDFFFHSFSFYLCIVNHYYRWSVDGAFLATLVPNLFFSILDFCWFCHSWSLLVPNYMNKGRPLVHFINSFSNSFTCTLYDLTHYSFISLAFPFLKALLLIFMSFVVSSFTSYLFYTHGSLSVPKLVSCVPSSPTSSLNLSFHLLWTSLFVTSSLLGLCATVLLFTQAAFLHLFAFFQNSLLFSLRYSFILFP